MGDNLDALATGNGAGELESWLGAALAIGRDHLGLSLKDACRQLAGVSDKTLMKWESGERLHPLSYAIELARRDEVTRSMLIQALAREGPKRGQTPSDKDGESILLRIEAMLESALGDGPER